MESGRWKQVMFLAGGAASGKSMGVAIWLASQNVTQTKLREFLTVDGTLSDYQRAQQYCEIAAAYQHQVIVLYVFCPVEKA
jgi:hypothetical protein